MLAHQGRTYIIFSHVITKHKKTISNQKQFTKKHITLLINVSSWFVMFYDSYNQTAQSKIVFIFSFLK